MPGERQGNLAKEKRTVQVNFADGIGNITIGQGFIQGEHELRQWKRN